jgi:hypothetical protein
MELTGSVAGIIKLLGGGSTVIITPLLLEGVAIAKITVDDTDFYIYAPEGGSEVSVSPTLQAGTKIGDITIGENTVSLYAPNPTSVSVSQDVTEGTQIGSITVNGVTTNLFAPNPTSVNVTQNITEGTQIGSITVNGVTTNLFAPASGGGGGGVNYSTSEIKVGTYTENGVDYDLYEKTYNITLSGAVTQISLADLNIKDTISINGKIYNNSDEIIMPFYENSAYNGRTKYNKDNKMLQIILSNDSFSYYRNALYNIFYTKNS